jgi:uncharacterized membrane protein YeaQ/YmgE (transglycosylase-associated protein family)
MEIGSLISWIVFGLIVGALARLLVPGRDRLGWLATILLGIVGSVVGGLLAYAPQLHPGPYAPGGWVLSTLGAVAVLLVYYRLTNNGKKV